MGHVFQPGPHFLIFHVWKETMEESRFLSYKHDFGLSNLPISNVTFTNFPLPSKFQYHFAYCIFRPIIYETH